MKSKGTANKEIKELTVPVNTGTDHVLGYVNAPLNIAEYRVDQNNIRVNVDKTFSLDENTKALDCIKMYIQGAK
jgi:hypothetical protein